MTKKAIKKITAQPQFIVFKNNPSFDFSFVNNLKSLGLCFKSAPQCLHLIASALIASAQKGHCFISCKFIY